jgi:hypothetical protein
VTERTYGELREQAVEAVTLILTATKMDREPDQSGVEEAVDDLLTELLPDPMLTIFVLGALAGMAAGALRKKCEEEFDGDWAATMADMRKHVT